MERLFELLAPKRGQFRIDDCGHIRHKETGRCPLCEACQSSQGYTYDNDEFDRAGAGIGLDKWQSYDIALAADNDEDKARFDPVLRNRMVDELVLGRTNDG